MKYIGFSLTLCVTDIILGKVDPDDVVAIFAGTRFRNRKDLEERIPDYCKLYWDWHPKLAKEIALALWDTGRIIQPLLAKNPETPLNVAHNRWAIVQEAE